MPPTRARKPGLLNRQFGFPGATGKQKNPAFAFVPDQDKNKRRIFWFRKTNKPKLCQTKPPEKFIFIQNSPPSRSDKLVSGRGRKPARHSS